MKRRLAIALFLPLLLLALLDGCKAGTTTTSAASTGATAVTSTAGSAGGAATSSAGPTQCPTSNTTSFAKAKFLLHTGLAFGAFHRYIYKPFRAGSFKSGAHGRVLAFVKAGTAALFVKREVRLASEDVKANPTLCKAIAAPLQAVGDTISGAVSSLKSGDISALTTLESTVTCLESKASSAGTTITENANAPLS